MAHAGMARRVSAFRGGEGAIDPRHYDIIGWGR